MHFPLVTESLKYHLVQDPQGVQVIQTKFDGGNLLVGLTIGWHSMVCLAVIVILF